MNEEHQEHHESNNGNDCKYHASRSAAQVVIRPGSCYKQGRNVPKLHDQGTQTAEFEEFDGNDNGHDEKQDGNINYMEGATCSNGSDEKADPGNAYNVTKRTFEQISGETRCCLVEDVTDSRESSTPFFGSVIQLIQMLVNLFGRRGELEFGLYKDTYNGCLQVDWKPWIEFGNEEKIFTDILDKKNSCLKKCILTLPEWISYIWKGKLFFQRKYDVASGGVGIVQCDGITDGVCSLTLARKTIPKKKWRNEEIQALLRLQTKGFVPMVYGVLAHDDNLALLLEMIDGVVLTTYSGNLYDKIQLFHSLVAKVCQLHKEDIFHQDLKLSNIIVRDPNDPSSVVIIDFGSTIMQKSDKNHLRPITACLCPPDLEQSLLNRYLPVKFDEQVKRLLVAWDSWQLGMILFNLLTRKNLHINGKVTQDNLNFTREKMKQYINRQLSDKVDKIPPNILPILIGLLEVDYRKRLTPEFVRNELNKDVTFTE
ncbi:uncharacterized protein LOC127726290 isoform X1 [Mytilus californianus]|uniref:uncharacterized protein LOC127726290 isoform X1 n=1 Tax=Mytilus californianus TaxID=6549 RepID=UPI002245B0EA|nr:uncharacterized protein LOC127726290 isoform X1 [Mytilus californianus]XP_052089569.1 uncharacterized protein LOC127726290 isoform X1 [Mytilus californianus]